MAVVAAETGLTKTVHPVDQVEVQVTAGPSGREELDREPLEGHRRTPIQCTMLVVVVARVSQAGTVLLPIVAKVVMA